MLLSIKILSDNVCVKNWKMFFRIPTLHFPRCDIYSDVARGGLAPCQNIGAPLKNSDRYKHVHYIFISCNGNFISSYVLNSN